MLLTLEHNGTVYQNADVQTLINGNVPDAVITAAAKAAGVVAVGDLIEGFRVLLAPPSPAKIAEYLLKEEIAKDPGNADPVEVALIVREAAARGLTQTEMMALITVKATSFRQAALFMAAVEAEATLAVTALTGTAATIAAEIAQVITATETQATAAIAATTQVIQGGS